MTETLSFNDKMASVINLINAEEIQVGKDIPEVGSNALEEQVLPC